MGFRRPLVMLVLALLLPRLLPAAEGIQGLLPGLDWNPAPGSTEDVYRRSGPGVVLLWVGQEGSGSGRVATGTLVSSEGYIVTSFGAIQAGGFPSRDIRVALKPAQVTGDPARDLTVVGFAALVTWDRDLDLALVRMPLPARGPAPVPLSPVQAIPDDDAIAIGHAPDLGLWSLAATRVADCPPATAHGTPPRACRLQQDVPGDYEGAPLLDADGRLMGILAGGKTSAMGRPGTPPGPHAAIRSAVPADALAAFLGQVPEARAVSASWKEARQQHLASLQALAAARTAAATPAGPRTAIASRSSSSPSSGADPSLPPRSARTIRADFRPPARPFRSALVDEVVARVTRNAREAFEELDRLEPTR